MTKPEPPALDDVLAQYAIEGPSPERLAQWAADFPHYESELHALTEGWLAPRLPVVDPTVEEASEARMAGHARSLMAAHFAGRWPELDGRTANSGLGEVDAVLLDAVPLESSAEASNATGDPTGSPAAVDALVRRAGLTKREVQRRAGIGPSLWALVRSGALSHSSGASKAAYDRLTSGLGQVLGVSAGVVVSAVPRRLQLAAGESCAPRRPGPGSPVDALEAIREDPRMSDAARRYYLTGAGTPPYAEFPSEPS